MFALMAVFIASMHVADSSVGFGVCPGFVRIPVSNSVSVARFFDFSVGIVQTGFPRLYGMTLYGNYKSGAL